MYEFSFPAGACWNVQWSSNCNCASWDWSVPVHRLFHVTADQAATNVLGAGRALAHHSALETKQASKEGIGAHLRTCPAAELRLWPLDGYNVTDYLTTG